MGVTTQQLLQPDMGVRLPEGVRGALVEMGWACNESAVFLHQAMTVNIQMESMLELHRAVERPQGLRLQVTADMQQLTDQHFEQAIVVLARAGTAYAVYASQVAAAVAIGRVPPLPGSEVIRPSDLITACGMYLPEIRFTAGDEESTVVDEQNSAVAGARQHLIDLITYQLQGESTFAYDDIAAITVEEDGNGGVSRLVEFADALHVYAAVLVWALSVFSGVKTDNQ